MLIGLVGAGGLVGQQVIRCIRDNEKFNSHFISLIYRKIRFYPKQIAPTHGLSHDNTNKSVIEGKIL